MTAEAPEKRPRGAPVSMSADTPALSSAIGPTVPVVRNGSRVTRWLPSRALSRSIRSGTPLMFGVQLDRFDDQVECVDVVDLARHAVGSIWREVEAFGEVEQAIHTPSVVIQHDQHRAGSVFRPRDQEQMIGAEVKHGRNHEWGPKPPPSWQRR